MATGRSLASQFQGLSLDNVGAWPPAPRITMWMFVIAICAVGGWFGLWSGQKDQLEQLQTEEQKLKDEYKRKLQQAINLEELRKQREQVSQYVLTLEKQLPSKSEMDALLSDINQAGVGRGLDFELFRPGRRMCASTTPNCRSQSKYRASITISERLRVISQTCPLYVE